jgi:hypothetical protein
MNRQVFRWWGIFACLVFTAAITGKVIRSGVAMSPEMYVMLGFIDATWLVVAWLIWVRYRR